MKPTMRPLITMFLVFSQICVYAQPLLYTSEESLAIHKSIDQTRWDIGGLPSQYSFRYMSEFFPVSIVAKSSQPYLFPSEQKKSIENISIEADEGTITFEEYLIKLHIASFIIVHKGKIVYEKYFSMLPDDKHTLQSVTKVVTSLLITNLINEKKIDIDAPIEKYITELEGSDWEGISVRDILHMRTGMDSKSIDYSTGPFTNPAHKNYQLESALGILPKTPNTPSSVYKFLAEMKKDGDKGVNAEYSNINTFVLGWLAEKVTGVKYSDLVSERIWKPMGASSDAYVCVSENGLAWTHGGLSTTLRDLGRFGMLFTNNEIKQRKEDLISSKQLNDLFTTPAIANSFAPFKWAYQWDLASDGVMMKGGFGGQALYIVPEKDIVVAYFNYVDEDWGINNMISEAALEEILKALDDVK